MIDGAADQRNDRQSKRSQGSGEIAADHGEGDARIGDRPLVAFAASQFAAPQNRPDAAWDVLPRLTHEEGTDHAVMSRRLATDRDDRGTPPPCQDEHAGARADCCRYQPQWTGVLERVHGLRPIPDEHVHDEGDAQEHEGHRRKTDETFEASPMPCDHPLVLGHVQTLQPLSRRNASGRTHLYLLRDLADPRYLPTDGFVVLPIKCHSNKCHSNMAYPYVLGRILIVSHGAFSSEFPFGLAGGRGSWRPTTTPGAWPRKDLRWA